MFSRIIRWLNERWPLEPLLRLALEEEMPGGTSYVYVFGSSVFIVFLLQVLTGVWQLLYYVPMIDRAYDSLNYLRIEVPFGWLIHGLHYWGASAMIILVGLHFSQAFIWGAYKNPRQLTWLIGVAQLLVTLALGFTGPVLPWDERGYWEAEVAVSSSGTVPLLGTVARNLLSGGSILGQMTLSRFFFLHVAVLPGLLMICIGLHLVSFRASGISGPWDEAKRKQTGHFWPDQVFKDTVIMVLIFVVLVGLAAFLKAPFSGPLDTMESQYVPKPEWYFLFFYQTLKAFHGWLEPVGTIGIPVILTLSFFFLPFVDRSPERNPGRRPAAMICFAVFVAWVITTAVIGAYSKPPESVVAAGTISSRATKDPPPAAAAPASTPGPHGPPEAASFIIGDVESGSTIFHQDCEACHGPQGTDKVPNPGSADGTVPSLHPIDPGLFSEKAQTFVDRIDPYIQHGSIPEGPNPAFGMLPFGDNDSLTQQMIANVEAYILHLNGVDRAQPVHPGIEPRTFFWWVVVVFGVAIGGFWIWKGR